MPLTTKDLNVNKLWLSVIRQGEEDLDECPSHVHADCPRMAARDWFRSRNAEEMFAAVNQEHRLEQIRKSLPEPCIHEQRRNKLLKALKEH